MMRVAFVGNQDNHAYRLCKWARELGVDAELYLIRQESGPRSAPELVDGELGGGPESYPDWLRMYDDTSRLSFLRRSEVARRIERGYDVVVTSGVTGMLAANHFRHIPIVHYCLGSEVNEFPTFLFARRMSVALRGASFLVRRALAKVRKVVINYQVEGRVLAQLGHREKIVVFGFPEDTEGNRSRIDDELAGQLSEKYADVDRVFMWFNRLNYLDRVSPECKHVDVFLDAYERLIADGAGGRVKAVVGTHGKDVEAFQAAATDKGLDAHIDYVPHLPFRHLLTYLSMDKGVYFDIPDKSKGGIGGAGREALSVGAVLIRSIHPELIFLCYGPDCPIWSVVDVASCHAAMAEVLAMDDERFARHRQAHMDWADRYLNYKRHLPRFIHLLHEVAFADGVKDF